MQNFKRILKNTLIFSAFVVAISLFLGFQYYRSGYGKYYVFDEIHNQQNSYDTIICGASQGAIGIVPQVLDEELGINCFNASTQGGPLISRLDLCKEMIELNPVKTVILDMSETALAGYNKNSKTENILISHRISWEDKIPFLLRNISVKYWFDTWNEIITYGTYETAYQRITFVSTGSLPSPIYIPENYLGKGYYLGYDGKPDFDASEHIKNYQSKTMEFEIDRECIEKLNVFFDLCDSKGIEVIVVSLPSMNTYLDQFTDIDKVLPIYKELCKDRGYRYLNFNLHKQKDEYIPDNSCFYDAVHLSTDGGYKFSYMLADTIKKLNGSVDVEELFYNSYSDVQNRK